MGMKDNIAWSQPKLPAQRIPEAVTRVGPRVLKLPAHFDKGVKII